VIEARGRFARRRRRRLALELDLDAQPASERPVVAADELAADGAGVGEALQVAARDEDVVELMHLLRGRVLPCAVKSLLEEGGERGELVSLEEGAQPAAGSVDVLDAERADGVGMVVGRASVPTTMVAPAGAATIALESAS